MQPTFGEANVTIKSSLLERSQRYPKFTKLQRCKVQIAKTEKMKKFFNF